MKRFASFRGAVRLACLLCGAASAALASAGTFSVTPVRIYMAPKDRAVAVTIVNEGDAPVVLQADLNLWSQTADGADELTPTEDLVLSPPIVKLAPGARQVVRLALARPPDASRQLIYRLVMREIPEAAPPKGNVQVPISLALSMPVFVTPPPATRDVACRIERNGDAVAALCANSGTAYAQVREARLTRGAAPLAAFEGGVYILPGARKSIPLKGAGPLTSGAAQLAVSFDDAKTQSLDVELR